MLDSKMLDPDQRLLLTQAFRAPIGHQPDFALATTYSLDLSTLLGSTLHLSVLGNDGAAEDLQNGVMLLEGLRRSAERLVVFCQTSQIYVPKIPHILYGLLEPVVVPVTAPLGGVFHPKFWVLRFIKEGEKPLLRVVVLSRNLTHDRSWDIALAMEGTTTGRRWTRNEGLRDLVAALPDMSSRTSALTRMRVLELAEQLHSAEWQYPEGIDEMRFSSLGLTGRGWKPQQSQKLAVISPFISSKALQQLARSTNNPVLLVSRPEELDKLAVSDRQIFPQCFTLQEAAESEDGEDLSPDSSVLQGLHAKLYISQNGWDTTITLGSANATKAAIVDGQNVELLVELTGKTSKVGAIDRIFSPEGFGKLLEPYQPGELPAEDSAVQLAEKRLEAGKAALAAADLRVSCVGEGDQRQLTLRPGGPVFFEGIESLRAWPVSLKPEFSTDVMQIRHGEDATLTDCSLAAVTAFIAFEMTSPPAPDSCRFVLNLPVDGMPEDRRAAVVRMIVANREGFLKYLLFLLADFDEDGLPNDVLLAVTGQGNQNKYSLQSALPLLEEMTRALSREPARLDSIQSLIEDLVSTEQGKKMVDEQFLKLWDVYASVLKDTRL
jgi:hypothetical protein